MKRLVAGLALASLSLIGMVTGALGCKDGGADHKIRVGTLDSARILQEMPDYKDVQEKIQSDESAFRSRLPDPNTKLKPEQMSKIQDELVQKRRDWEKVVRDMMKASVEKITTASQEVAKTRDLDMIVVNTTTDPVYYSGGQDVTLDVLLKVQK